MKNLLSQFYLYRPDIGFKRGMEIYALVLAKNIKKEKLLKIYVSLIIDIDLIFGVFKGETTCIQTHLDLLKNNFQ